MVFQTNDAFSLISCIIPKICAEAEEILSLNLNFKNKMVITIVLKKREDQV